MTARICRRAAPLGIDRARWLRPTLAAVMLAALVSGAPPRAAQAAPRAFDIRGVGYNPYGSVWRHADRMDMIGWLATHGMNMYIHMPHEDMYTTVRWRTPYPDDVMTEFGAEIALANSLGVRWVPGVQPGRPLVQVPVDVDICFSCDADFEVLAAKYQRFYDLGARAFTLSFNDTTKTSSHPDDVVAFGVGDASYGRMNAFLANRLQDRFPDSLVILYPADYSGTTQTEYLKALSESLASRVLVAWDGPAVFNRRITAADADAFGEAISPADGPRRLPLLWDHYPVNDVHGEAFDPPAATAVVYPGYPYPPHPRLYVGPYKGRHADLAGHVAGVLAEPMNQAQASKLALYTIADYLSDPARYTDDPADCPLNPNEHTRAGCLAEEVWLAGVTELGGTSASALLDFVNQTRSSPLDRTESPVFVELRNSFAAAFAAANWEPRWASLRAELVAERSAPDALRTSAAPSAGFLDEVADHLDTLETNARAGIAALDMLHAQRPNVASVAIEVSGETASVSGVALHAEPSLVASHAATLAPLEAAMRASPFVVHGDRLPSPLGAALGTDVVVMANEMDAFLDHAHTVTAAWLPLVPLATVGPLTVSVNGTDVTTDADGSFVTTVNLVSDAIEIIVTDAAGFSTARTYSSGHD